MKTVLKIIIVTVFVFSIGTAMAASDTAKVGVLYSITGKGSAVAKVQLDGVKLAIKQVNEKGGVMVEGKKVMVEPVIRDDETKPDVGVRRIRELVDEGVRVVVGGTFAHVSTAINEQIKQGQAYFMATNGIQEKVFRKENKAPYYISSLGAVDGIGRMCADYVAKTFEPKSVTLFLPDYAYGRGAAAGAHKIFDSKYPDIKVDEVWSPVGTPDFTSYIIKIKEAKPDIGDKMYEYITKILPGGFRRSYMNLMRYCDIKTDHDKLIGFVIFFGLAVALGSTVGIFSVFSIPFSYIFFVTFVATYFLFEIIIYMWLLLSADSKARSVEKVLPDSQFPR